MTLDLIQATNPGSLVRKIEKYLDENEGSIIAELFKGDDFVGVAIKATTGDEEPGDNKILIGVSFRDILQRFNALSESLDLFNPSLVNVMDFKGYKLALLKNIHVEEDNIDYLALDGSNAHGNVNIGDNEFVAKILKASAVTTPENEDPGFITMEWRPGGSEQNKGGIYDRYGNSIIEVEINGDNTESVFSAFGGALTYNSVSQELRINGNLVATTT